jgi:transcriptional regulator with XRE-family HTH domain
MLSDDLPRFRSGAIRELMSRHNLTASGFAALIGVSRQRVSLWAKGAVSPQFPIVLLMCRDFGVDPGFFAEGLKTGRREADLNDNGSFGGRAGVQKQPEPDPGVTLILDKNSVG